MYKGNKRKTKELTRAFPRRSDEPSGKKAKPLIDTRKNKIKNSVARQALERWKTGTPMLQLEKELGVYRRIIQRAIIKLVGGENKFQALRAAGAGGKAFGGKRGTGGRTKQDIAADDSKVPVLQSKDIPLRVNSAVLAHARTLRTELYDLLESDHKLTDSEQRRMRTGWRNAKQIVKREESMAKWKGWRCEHYQSRYGVQVRLLAPDGKRYVRAAPTERADYIVVSAGMLRTRFKHEKEARVAKVDEQESKLIEHGQKVQKHRKKLRKQKHAAKKSRAA